MIQRVARTKKLCVPHPEANPHHRPGGGSGGGGRVGCATAAADADAADDLGADLLQGKVVEGVEVLEAVARALVDVVLEERQASVGEVEADVLVPVLNERNKHGNNMTKNITSPRHSAKCTAKKTTQKRQGCAQKRRGTGWCWWWSGGGRASRVAACHGAHAHCDRAGFDPA